MPYHELRKQKKSPKNSAIHPHPPKKNNSLARITNISPFIRFFVLSKLKDQ